MTVSFFVYSITVFLTRSQRKFVDFYCTMSNFVILWSNKYSYKIKCKTVLHMYKAFLVEDEVIVREGLRDNIDWENCGFSYIGDAADGETALPMIRELKPDLVLTDIRMPFMDGLALSDAIKKELPDTRIIIISGFDDFSYAQRAIHIGVEQYLLKPVTKAKMVEVLTEIRKKMDREAGQKNYLEQFLQEAQEYEQFSKRRFFEQLTAGGMSDAEIREAAEDLDLDIEASCYNIVALNLTSTGHSGENPDRYTDALAALQGKLVHYFLSCPEYLLFRWNVITYILMIKGEPGNIDKLTSACIENIVRRCRECGGEASWFVSSGTPVTELTELSDCFSEAMRLLSYRHICPDEHLLTSDCVDSRRLDGSKGASSSVDPELIRKFLSDGAAEEVELFLTQLLGKSGDALLSSYIFSQYFSMTVFLKTVEFVDSLGCGTDAISAAGFRERLQETDPSAVKENARQIIRLALELRDGESRRHYNDFLKLAFNYIDAHYFDSSLSLDDVARAANVTPGYLSAVLSQEHGQTFAERLTQVRMNAARRLLTLTDMRNAEIAEAVGYKDPRYFSYIFKKTQGCAPRDFRGGAKS